MYKEIQSRFGEQFSHVHSEGTADRAAQEPFLWQTRFIATGYPMRSLAWLVVGKIFWNLPIVIAMIDGVLHYYDRRDSLAW